MKTADRLFQIIERETGLTREQITSDIRDEEFVFARRIACYFLNEDKMPHGVIARILRRDIASIRRMVREHESQYQFNAKFRALFDSVKERLLKDDLVISWTNDEVYGRFK